ncbi:uncharacterized protein LOC123523213 [Mercenaria mercenaria]|uniref:uncharacterized protein LOC123523213 n=1 Tax=Mercenaria mercenaria TaxID=6596 RepID=UPI00234F54B9|nr:uncharacterized protein LOC123523213 [Mercenaria mercenaria]
MKKGWDIVFFLYIQLRITTGSRSQDQFCLDAQVYPELYQDYIVNICTDHSVSVKRWVLIDTASVPKFQQSFCECIISPFQPGAKLALSVHGGNGVKFQINNIVLHETIDNGITYLQGETTLYFSTDKNYTVRFCAGVSVPFGKLFNITCMHPTTLVTDTTASVTSRAITTTISKDNITMSVTTPDTTTEASPKDNITKPDTTTEASSKDNITTSVTTADPTTGNITTSVTTADTTTGNITTLTQIIVVLAVVGLLLILAAAVLLLVFVKRRRLKTDIERHDPEPSEQGQGQQNNPENEEGNLDVSVNAYERLNMYINDKLAGEMYQQLNTDTVEEYQEMYDVVNDSRNRNRNDTKQVNMQETEQGRTPSKEQLKKQAKGQGNNSNGEDRNIEIPANAYARLNMYVTDNVAGEMYEQLGANQCGDYRGEHVPGKKDRPVNKSDHGTNTNKQAFAVYANAK